MNVQNDSVHKGTDEETTEMLYFKACPKCQTGTIEHTNDPWSEYVQCLNCGLMRDLPEGKNAVQLLQDLKVQYSEQIAAEEAEEARAIA